MNYSFSISTRHHDEYRIILFDVKSANKDLPVQEYRSRLFSHIFDSYMYSHQVSGISNTPIIIRGEGYTQYMHLIARNKHREIVGLVKYDVLEGWGK